MGLASVRVSGRKQTHLFEKCTLVADSKFTEFVLLIKQACRGAWSKAKSRGVC